MKKKILHILYSGLGGHASVVFSYLGKDFLDNYDHELLFFGVEDLNPEFVEVCRQRALPYSFIKKEGALFPVHLFRGILSSKADLILTHSLPVVPVLHFLSRFFGRKYCLIEHATIELKRPRDLGWVRMAKKSATKLIYLSNGAKEEAKSFFKLKDSKLEVIPNGINTQAYAPGSDLELSGEIKLVCHGRLVKVKNLDLVLRAVARLLDKDHDLKLIFAGEGEELASLQDLSRSLNIEQFVQFKGVLSEEEIKKLLAESDIYINSSVVENMSTALMQAMSASLICIVSDIEGNKHMIQHKKTGMLFKSGDLDSLIESLEMAISDKRMSAELRKNARFYAKENFSIDRVQRNYLNLANSLLS